MSTLVYRLVQATVLLFVVLHETADRLICSCVCHLSVCKADIVLVIDSSGSIQRADPGNWDKVKQFLQNLIDNVNVGHEESRIAAVTFSNEGYLQWKLSRYTTNHDVKLAIGNLPYIDGNTNTTGGLVVARQGIFKREFGDRSDVKNVLILVTDGVTTRDADKLPGEVQTLKDMGVLILAVGVTNNVNRYQLESLVTEPASSNYQSVDDFVALSGVVKAVSQAVCEQ